MAKEKFDAKKEALKFLADENSRLDEMPQVKSESSKRSGTRVCVNMMDGTRKAFFYAEGGMFQGWNED